jgi:arylsulfatase A-like enzyme
MDDGIGKVLDTLERTGLAKNTLVIFTSDNGGVLANGNNGPGGRQAAHVRRGLRVPFATRWPGTIAAGTRAADRPLHGHFPTVQAAGQTQPKESTA